jgi:hypothetical protein
MEVNMGGKKGDGRISGSVDDAGAAGEKPDPTVTRGDGLKLMNTAGDTTVGLALFTHVILQSKHQLMTAGMVPV